MMSQAVESMWTSAAVMGGSGVNGLKEAKRREPKTFWGSQVQNIVNNEKEMK